MSKLKVPQLLQQAEQHQKAGNLAEMEKVCLEIVAVRDDVPKVWHLLGIASLAKGNQVEAITQFQKSLAIFPDSTKVLCDLASALIETGRIDEALPLLNKARSLKGDSSDISLALGKALLQQQRFSEAHAELKSVVEKSPNNAEARLKFGNALRGLGMWDQALAEYQTAARIDSNYADAFVNLGSVLYRMGRVEEATLPYRRAVSINPNMFQARNNLGVAFNDLQRFAEAVEQFQMAVKLNPQHAKAWHGLGQALRSVGAYDEALAANKKAVELAPENPIFGDTLVTALNYLPSSDAAVRFTAARQWAERFADPLLSSFAPHANAADPARKLKIGYVSPDFRFQPIVLHFDNVIRHHNREQFEIHCFYNFPGEDPLTARIRERADHWHPIAPLDDTAVANLVRAQEIDILVDLSLHSPGNRLLVFARKPAPVQVTWLGYVGTTGLKQIDYRLTDRFLDPPERSDEHYSERSVRLPESYCSFDPITPPIASVPTPGIAKGNVTFGCLNQFTKINEPIVSLWSAVLKAVPNSKMILQADEGVQQQRLKAWFEKHQVAADRLEFVAQVPRLEHLQTFQQMDLVLDTYPYSGGTTVFDALWMGVPVLTLCGKDALSRTSLSALANLGIAEALVVTSPQQFVERALALTSDLQRLNGLRQQILPRLQQSPVMNHARFVAGLEAAYRDMWQAWCQKK